METMTTRDYRHPSAIALGRFIAQQRIANTDFSQEALSLEIGKSKGYMSRIEGGHTTPSPKLATKLEKALKLPFGAILNKVLAIKGVNIKATENSVLGPSAFSNYTKIPLLSTCPASAERIMDDEMERWIEFPTEQIRGRHMYLLRVEGDSMNRAGIDDGDIVLVDADREPQKGSIAVVRVDDACTIKRWAKYGDTVVLSPDSLNPRHQPAEIDASEKLVQIRGVVESIWNKKVV